mmetsp:Transcript_126427/g.319286  ORF Transcript_126427/g.319286 Transcript_126427/m.319286 type:complete len:221 (+) Transcript_126427:208-870(+)
MQPGRCRSHMDKQEAAGCNTTLRNAGQQARLALCGEAADGVLDDGAADLRHELGLDACDRGLPPTALLHLCACDEQALQEAVVVRLLPLQGEEQTAGADPAQVDTGILEVVLEHPVVPPGLSVEDGPHGEPIAQFDGKAPFFEGGVCASDEGLDVLGHDVVGLHGLRLLQPLQESVHGCHDEGMTGKCPDDVIDARSLFGVAPRHKILRTADHTYRQAAA